MTTGTGKRRQTYRPILDWYQRHPGTVKSPQEIAEELGLNPHSAQTAAAKMHTEGILDYGGTRGSYVYRGRNAKVGLGVVAVDRKPIKIDDLLVCVGFNDKGEAIVRDENNVVYYAKPVT